MPASARVEKQSRTVPNQHAMSELVRVAAPIRLRPSWIIVHRRLKTLAARSEMAAPAS